MHRRRARHRAPLQAWLVAGLVLAVLACVGCGGGSGSTTSPTSTTSLSLPAGGVCGVLGGATGTLLGIINGAECPPGNSSVVLVELRDKSGNAFGACSGTVVAPRAVLTAAHCLLNAGSVSIYLGNPERVAAVSFAAFPGFDRPITSADAGVVLTSEDLPRRPIPLLVSRQAQVGDPAVIAGWGRDQFGNGTTLRAGTTSISAMPSAALETRYDPTSSATCAGDSGGALFLSHRGEWILAGVASAGTECVWGVSYYTNLNNPSLLAFIAGLAPGIVQR